MARDHLDRKALKEDPYQDAAFWLIDWIYQRRALIGSLVTAVVLVVVAGFAYYFYQRSVDKELAGKFYQAERIQPGSDLTEEQTRESLREGYRAFLKENPQARLAPVAWLNLARFAWEEKEPKTAREAFQAVQAHAKSTQAQQDIARLGIAKIEEAQGNLEASATQYNLLPDQPYEELKAYNLGRIASMRKQSDEARIQFEKAARNSSESSLARWAREQLDYRP